MLVRRLRKLIPVAFGLAVIAGGCADTPSAPVVEDGQLQLVLLSAPASATFARGGNHEASEVIGAEGGTIKIPGGHTLTFPAGALSEPTLIEARASAREVGVEFSPHGLQFPVGNEPVLTFNLQKAAQLPAFLAVGYVVNGQIVEVLRSNVDVEGGTISASLKHFSKYATVGG